MSLLGICCFDYLRIIMFNCVSRIHQSTLISDIFYINQVLKEYEKEIKKKKKEKEYGSCEGGDRHHR